MEDADGRLSVSERSVPTIERKDKEADEYDRHRMGYSQQKKRHLEQYDCA